MSPFSPVAVNAMRSVNPTPARQESGARQAPGFAAREGGGGEQVDELETPGLHAAPVFGGEANRLHVSRYTFYYGWVILPLAMMAMVVTAPGQTFAISIFTEPMRQSLNLTHGEMAAAYTLGTLLGAIPMMFIGSVMDRHGLRQTLLVVLSLFCLACGLVCLVDSWLMLAFSFFLLRMLGPGAISLLSGSILPFWFDRRLGLVEGLRSFAYACSMATIPAVNLYLVNAHGWRGAYAILGGGIWLVLFPLYFWLLRNSPAEVGQVVDGHEQASLRQMRREPMRRTETPLAAADFESAGATVGARPTVDLSLAETLCTFSFWVASLGVAIFGLVMTGIFFCLVPLCQERGLNEQHAAQVMLGFAISLAVAQLLGGLLADRFPAPPLMTCGLLGLVQGVWLLHSARYPATAILAGIVLGAGLGIHSGAAQPLWARYFGRRHLGKIRGFLMTMNIGLASVGPLVAGLAHDRQGNFDSAMWVFIVVPVPLAILSWFAVPPTLAAGRCDD